MAIRIVRYGILAADLVWLLGALVLAIDLHYAATRSAADLPAVFRTYSLLTTLALLSWTLFYFEMSLDGFKGGWYLPAIFSQIIVAVSLLMLLLLAVAFLTKGLY